MLAMLAVGQLGGQQGLIACRRQEGGRKVVQAATWSHAGRRRRWTKLRRRTNGWIELWLLVRLLLLLLMVLLLVEVMLWLLLLVSSLLLLVRLATWVLELVHHQRVALLQGGRFGSLGHLHGVKC